jgi:hypothetical protein
LCGCCEVCGDMWFAGLMGHIVLSLFKFILSKNVLKFYLGCCEPCYNYTVGKAGSVI